VHRLGRRRAAGDEQGGQPAGERPALRFIGFIGFIGAVRAGHRFRGADRALHDGLRSR